MMKFSELRVGRVYQISQSERLQYKILEGGHIRRRKDNKSWSYCDSSHNWLIEQDYIEVVIPYTFDEAKVDCDKTGQNYYTVCNDGVLETHVYLMRQFGTTQFHVCSEDKQCFIPLDGKWYKYDQ